MHIYSHIYKASCIRYAGKIGPTYQPRLASSETHRPSIGCTPKGQVWQIHKHTCKSKLTVCSVFLEGDGCYTPGPMPPLTMPVLTSRLGGVGAHKLCQWGPGQRWSKTGFGAFWVWKN